MANNVEFHDFSIEAKTAFEKAALAWLHEAAGELVSQTARTSPVDTGQLKNSWQYKVDEGKLEATIGSPLENAIWNEYGTGEFAANGDGRKGGWVYTDRKGKTHFTRGKHPKRTFITSFTKLKPKLIKLAQERFKEVK